MARGFFDAIWPDFDDEYGEGTPVYRMGEVLNYAKEYMTKKWTNKWEGHDCTRKVFEEYNWFGDPTMEIWTAPPKDLQVNYSYNVDTHSLEVVVTSDGHPVEGAMVCLSQENGIYERGLTNSSGWVSLPVDSYSASSNEAILTVTAHNYRCSQSTVFIPLPPEPDFSIQPPIGAIGETIFFNGTAWDPNRGYIVNWTWDFGDGHYAYTQNVSHKYSQHGVYTVSLTVRDNYNLTETKSKKVRIYDALVDDNFTDDPILHKWDSIQEGIVDVDSGDWIYVFNGTYNGNIVINKSIYLCGESREGVIVIGGDSVITVGETTSVYIDGFTVRDGYTGVLNMGNLVLKNCSIYSNQLEGIKSTGICSIENCYLEGNKVGVKLIDSHNSSILSTSIMNSAIGLMITNGSYRNTVRLSTFIGNNYGIYIKNSNYTIIGGDQ